LAARDADLRALLATLFATRGTIMLTAGDEFGRSQRGNNNAYAQDNDLTWLDWEGADAALVAHVAALAALRLRFSVFQDPHFFTGENADVAWHAPNGAPMTSADWNDEEGPGLIMRLKTRDKQRDMDTTLTIAFNRSHEPLPVTLPSDGRMVFVNALTHQVLDPCLLPARSVTFAYDADLL
jgi:glycogen debranching enzyme